MNFWILKIRMHNNYNKSSEFHWEYLPKILSSLIHYAFGNSLSFRERAITGFMLHIWFMYRESTNIGQTLFLQNAQDIWKGVLIEFVHFQNVINTRKNILKVEKIYEIAFCPVRFFKSQCVQYWLIPCICLIHFRWSILV